MTSRYLLFQIYYSHALKTSKQSRFGACFNEELIVGFVLFFGLPKHNVKQFRLDLFIYLPKSVSCEHFLRCGLSKLTFSIDYNDRQEGKKVTFLFSEAVYKFN